MHWFCVINENEINKILQKLQKIFSFPEMKLAILFGVLLFSGITFSEEIQQDVKDDASLTNDEAENVADLENEIENDMDEDSDNEDEMDDSESDQLVLEDENESPVNDEEDQYEMDDSESDSGQTETEDENEAAMDDEEDEEEEDSELEDPLSYKPIKQCKTAQLTLNFLYFCLFFFISTILISTWYLGQKPVTKDVIKNEQDDFFILGAIFWRYFCFYNCDLNRNTK